MFFFYHFCAAAAERARHRSVSNFTIPDRLQKSIFFKYFETLHKRVEEHWQKQKLPAPANAGSGEHRGGPGRGLPCGKARFRRGKRAGPRCGTGGCKGCNSGPFGPSARRGCLPRQCSRRLSPEFCLPCAQWKGGAPPQSWCGLSARCEWRFESAVPSRCQCWKWPRPAQRCAGLPPARVQSTPAVFARWKGGRRPRPPACHSPGAGRQ